MATLDPLQPGRCAEKLSALAAPARLKIVRFLLNGPRTVTAIAEMLGVPAVNVTHHLHVLKVADLIRGTKKGRFVWYSIRPGIVRHATETTELDLGCCKLMLPISSQPNQSESSTSRE